MRERTVTIALGVAVVVLSALLVAKSIPKAEPPSTIADAGAVIDASPTFQDAATADLPISPPTTDGGFRLADGTFVPPLDSKAPRQVRFGVVLVVYAGAEGAPSKARGRDAALALATTLAGLAKSDFHDAVQRGDEGSAEDVGTVGRGVLEPTSEAVLFSLPAGGTSGVVDTPRGFWIVKRIE